MFFKLKPGAGNHSEKDENGKIVVYKSEDDGVIESENDLVKMFPNKFERVTENLTEPEPKEEPPVEPEPEPEGPLGKNVTDEFKRAQNEDFLVFRSEDGVFVAEADEPDEALNDEPLEDSRKAVNAFIKKYLKE